MAAEKGYKVRKRAKIRNQYNQAPHLTSHIHVSASLEYLGGVQLGIDQGIWIASLKC